MHRQISSSAAVAAAIVACWAAAAGTEQPIVAPAPLEANPAADCLFCCQIILPEGGERAAHATNIWPGGIVPYVFDGNVSTTNRNRALSAMTEIEATANIDFIPRTNEANYIHIRSANNNSSSVGMIGGRQNINIFNWTFRYIIIHELYHALGIWHEQQRTDRDQYVQINFQNVTPGTAGNFSIVSSSIAFGPYNFESIMHYDDFAFSDNGQPTITVLPPNQQFQNVIGNRSFLSQGDVEIMQHLYSVTGPGQFSLLEPADEATDVSTGPLLDWEDAADAFNYTITVDDDPDFSSPVFELDRTPSFLQASNGTFDEGVTYYWKVTANPVFGFPVTLSTPGAASFTIEGGQVECPGDVNGDDAVDAADLSTVIGNFGEAVAPGTAGDINGDGVVDAADLSIIIGAFGTTCDG